MAGTPIEVFTNSYVVVRMPTTTYFHYDGMPFVMEPESGIKRRNYEVMDRLQLEHAEIFTPRAPYDGKKNLFSPKDIPSATYTIALGRKMTVRVLMKKVSVVSPSDVQKLLRRRSPNDTSDSSISLTLLQLIVRQAPNMRHNFPADARSFYTQHNARNLRFGLTALRGYFQSVRPVLGKLLVNVDVSHAASYTPGPLIDTMMMHLDLRNPRQLAELHPQQFGQLRIFLKGVRVRMTLSKMRPRPISDLVHEAGLQEFDRDNERCSVARHFAQKYNCEVRFPRIVGVRVGKTAIFPAEFCEIIPGQLYRKKIPPDAQREFLQFATQKPHERMRDIENSVAGQGQLFDYASSDFMKEAGMEVDTRIMSVRGSVLSPPKIRYAGSDIPLNIRPKAGSWNVVGRRFVQPRTLRFWGVAVFDDRAPEHSVKEFITALIGNMEKAGMNVLNHYPPIMSGSTANPETTLEAVGQRSLIRKLVDQLPPDQKPHPQLIIVILPQNAAECRRCVKFWGDITRTVSTQCVRSPKWSSPSGRDQYCNNVALKINARLGGTNSILDTEAAGFLETSMVVGADVGHPGPGAATRPSVTGLVASVDPFVSKMTSIAAVQRPRQEIIEDLEKMMIEALQGWQEFKLDPKVPRPPPKHVIFYRDGVSEGEFRQVAEREIPLIKSAFVKMNIPPPLMPKLLFIVVGKRHHIRFFPRSPSDGDKSGNCPAGLVVNQHITNPNYDDFYLQSHAGLLGTSRPSHYVILANEPNLNPAQIQMLTFHLCHAYVPATRSVSVPAPVYYADRICGRMEFHCQDGASLSDTASNVTSANEEIDLEWWRQAFRPTRLNKSMYFI
ncbi:Piwi domain-containing protein [Trametes meyenii]|nr:Piwi domain-containing protein [Trametes meyenii]